jgi:hypothetical protein
MESAPIRDMSYTGDVKNVTIEDYDGNIFLNAYNYHDAFERSKSIIEASKKYAIGPALSTEATSLCDKKDGYGIIVIINTENEHGSLTNDGSPAHIHVLSNDRKVKIGQVNINGECPSNGNSVPLYRTSNENIFNSYRKKIATWANDSQVQKNGKFQNNWSFAKEVWKKYEDMGIFK